MRALRLLHLYTGLALSVLLLAIAVTGSALVYKEAYWRWVYPELRVPAPSLDAADHAAAIDAALERFGERVRSVKMPEPGVPAYHVYLDGGEAFLTPRDHALIDSWTTYERLTSVLFDLHAHLFSGAVGEHVVGVIGLIGAFMGVTGLVLWWPVRRRFRPANLVPRSLTRSALLKWHRDAGALLSPLLLLVLLTGSGLVFYGAAEKMLNALFGDAVPRAVAASRTSDEAYAGTDAALLERAESAFSDARLVFYYPPETGEAVVRLRLRRECELHPNGRTYLYVDAHHDAIAAKDDACTVPPGQRAVHAIYPLHAGKADSALYKLAVLVSGIALAGLAATGIVTYVQQLRRRRAGRRRQSSVSHPAGAAPSRAAE